ncbi:MAG: extracellular solute-binding protein [bacterium]|nr:extracellular solute-binding protein [bacterium]
MRKFLVLILGIMTLLSMGSFAFANQTKSINFIWKSGDQTWIKQTIKSYEQKYPDRKVNLQLVGGTEGNYTTKLFLMLSNDSSIDVFFEDSAVLGSTVASGYIAPLDGVKKWKDWNNFYPNLRKSVTFNGKVYAVPLSTDSRGLYYNTELFKKAGIKLPWQPKNWKDIIAAAKQIKKKLPGIIPFSMNIAANGESTTMQTLEMLLYGTNNTLYKDGKWVVTSKGLLNSLNFINTIFRKGLGPQPHIVMNTHYSTMIFQNYAMQQKVAIILDGCWAKFFLKPDPKIYNAYQFIGMPTENGQKPGYITMSGGWDLAINAKSSKKKLALDFIKYATSKESLLKYTKLSYDLTPRKDVAASPKYPAYLKGPTELLNYAHFRPSNQEYPIVSTKLQDAVESVALGSATPLQAMNTFAAAVQRAVGKDKILKSYK